MTTRSRAARRSADQSPLEAVSDALLAITAERSVEPILQKIVDAARQLTGARYAALGIPDDRGGFAQFITSGMTDEQMTAFGSASTLLHNHRRSA